MKDDTVYTTLLSFNTKIKDETTTPFALAWKTGISMA
ncbi:BnaCnng16320D [Brassica napus]|uniref:BnaCnng16320D protein n=1 Tax=Brassica napus TaxID=3708 RepID=A0A078IGA0_BRANA|nr:BnaCnng16320D [Brassica napus]